MSRLEKLQSAVSRVDFAKILHLKPSFLTHTLYIKPISSQYIQFKIPKKNGGDRIISAPSDELKDIQRRLSELLLDCIDEINKEKNITSSLSHGFSRNCSIITNAKLHVNQKNVLNLDLENFFESFNFGRVRGFFIKNKNFQLHNDIATVIAQIACYDNKLPQGSPCSPVITNLVTHSLDIRLASLAKKNSCTYSRYADDITFSTRKKIVPKQLAVINEDNTIKIGKKLNSEILRSGFSINDKKTRIQFKNSKQDVTGLTVNRKVNINSNYWRATRAMCHSLFMTGTYNIQINPEIIEGSIFELDGRLNFIDQIDKYNHSIEKPNYEKKFELKKSGLDYRKKLNVREKTFSKFLYFKYFYANQKPTILCEGKTDNIYLKSAIHQLANSFPRLARSKTATQDYELLIDFIEYTNRTHYLLDLAGGGTYLKKFLERFIDNYNYYEAPKPLNPVILVLDNDSGPNELIKQIHKDRKKYPECPINKEDIRDLDFLHIKHNLYLVLTPSPTVV